MKQDFQLFINNWIGENKKTISFLQVCIKNLKDLFDANSGQLFQKCGFFQHYYFLVTRVIYIELTKLFGQNKCHHFTIWKLEIQITKYFPSRMQFFKSYFSEVQQKYTDEIKKIETSRNKVFAHSDVDSINIAKINAVWPQQLEELITIANKILNELTSENDVSFGEKKNPKGEHISCYDQLYSFYDIKPLLRNF